MRKLVLVSMLVACSDAGPNPNVTVKSATPDTLVSSDDALDDVTITVDYDDGDGDLGGGAAEVHDCRADGIVTSLVLPQIAPEQVDGDSRITGSLELHVNDVGSLALGTQPKLCADLGVTSLSANETIFCVVLVDRKGHKGDGDCTTAIAVVEE